MVGRFERVKGSNDWTRSKGVDMTESFGFEKLIEQMRGQTEPTDKMVEISERVLAVCLRID